MVVLLVSLQNLIPKKGYPQKQPGRAFVIAAERLSEEAQEPEEKQLATTRSAKTQRQDCRQPRVTTHSYMLAGTGPGTKRLTFWLTTGKQVRFEQLSHSQHPVLNWSYSQNHASRSKKPDIRSQRCQGCRTPQRQRNCRHVWRASSWQRSLCNGCGVVKAPHTRWNHKSR